MALASALVITLEQRELDTVLAALRNWQQLANRDEMPEYQIALAEHDAPLDKDEIDGLYEAINMGAREPAATRSAGLSGTWGQHPDAPVAAGRRRTSTTTRASAIGGSFARGSQRRKTRPMRGCPMEACASGTSGCG